MRKEISINAGWQFHYGNEGGPWRAVDLPHTWNNLDGQDGGGDYLRGDAWYRRPMGIGNTFAEKGKQVYLQFNGVCLVSDAYFNGTHLGRHRGAFARFRYDITEYVKMGLDNWLTLKVNNERNPEVPPFPTDDKDTWIDFTIFGGIYRDASLLITDKLHIDPTFYGSDGVFVRQKSVSRQSASIEVTTKALNLRGKTDVTLLTRIVDAAGQTVASARDTLTMENGVRHDFVQAIDIDNPRLWNAKQDPYIYNLVSELMDGDEVTDLVKSPLGLRYFHVDANEGFYLNGKYFDLRGVSRHQDRIDKGWAISQDNQAEDFALISDMGCTLVRLAHYQHDQYFFDLCDRNGMIAWAELCLIGNCVDTPEFTQNTLQQLKELIYQNINHPSIVFWCILNEVFPKTVEKLAPLLHGTCHELDPNRLVTLAMHGGEEGDWGEHCDVEGVNKYFGWYQYSWYDSVSGEFGKFLDDRHRQYPERKLGVSEYGAGANVRHHEENPDPPDIQGQWHPEEYQAIVHERLWAAMARRKYLWCKIIWNGFDFAADRRNEGELPGINDKGLVTYDRKIKKDAYFFYKANWTADPFVYITSRRFVKRTSAAAEIKIYSNCDEAEVFINGRSLGRASGEGGVFIWKQAALDKGVNQIKAVGYQDGAEYRDTCEWEAGENW